MRILFVYQFCTIGGVEAVLFTRLQALTHAGIEAKALFLYDAGGRHMFDRVANQIAIITDEAEMRRFLLAEDPDFLISVDTPQIHPIAESISLRARFVYEVQTIYPEQLAYLGTPRLWRNVAGAIVPSQDQRDLVVRLLCRRDLPVRVVPNLFAQDFLTPLRLSIQPTAPVISWVGRLDTYQKNWHQFIELAGRVAVTDPNAEFWLVGGGAGASEKSKLWPAIKQHRLTARFRWIPSVRSEYMPRLYTYVGQSGGCLVSTSRLESFGMTVAEAMACRCPVVVPDVPGLSELVADGETGRVYPSGRLDIAAAIVLDLLKSGESRTLMTERAHRMVTERFTPERLVADLLAALDSLEGVRKEVQEGLQ